jgi:hypothetical protein
MIDIFRSAFLHPSYLSYLLSIQNSSFSLFDPKSHLNCKHTQWSTDKPENLSNCNKVFEPQYSITKLDLLSYPSSLSPLFYFSNATKKIFRHLDFPCLLWL